MDFEYDEEQLSLQTSVADVLAKECPSTYLRAVIDGEQDPQHLWAKLVGLDWTGLAIEPALGGSGASEVELMIMLEQLGYVSDPTPLLATTSQFAPFIAASNNVAQHERFLAPVASQGATGTVAFATVEGGWDLQAPAFNASKAEGGWHVSGTAHYVLDGDRADELVVLALTEHGVQAFVTPRASATSTRQPSLDGSLHLATVTLDTVVPDDRRLDADSASIAHAFEHSVLGIACTMVGACQRVLDITIGYVRTREQFGVPIGSFQAVKHHIVNTYMAIERARACTYLAAAAIAENDPRRSLSVSMAKAAAGDAQQLALRYGIQLHGGIGFTWENDLQMYVRRAQAGELLLGGASHHRLKTGQAVLSDSRRVDEVIGGASHFDDAAEAFRAEYVAWLDANLPDPADCITRPRSTADVPPWAAAWQRKQFDAGWLVPGNTPEYGGRNASLVEQFIQHEEISSRDMYASFNPQGLGIIAPSLLAFGTEEQKQRWALPVLRAEMTAALGMSEPGAGSDLAGLRTRAELRDGKFIVNGQKVWTSGAHHADFILTFVRTDPNAPKHKGISVLIIPTDTPGVTRRPFGSILGPHDMDFNEVFFDDVEVPEENLLGPLHGGWKVANGSLGHERSMLWLDYATRMVDWLDRFRDAVQQRPALMADSRVADDYGKVVLDAVSIKVLGLRALAKARRGAASSEESILKLFGSENVNLALDTAVRWLGPYALDHTQQMGEFNTLQIDAYQSSWFEQYLRSFAGTIAGGTSEIQRNIIADRVLGLPR